jgi:hypothetical protein
MTKDGLISIALVCGISFAVLTFLWYMAGKVPQWKLDIEEYCKAHPTEVLKTGGGEYTCEFVNRYGA